MSRRRATVAVVSDDHRVGRALVAYLSSDGSPAGQVIGPYTYHTDQGQFRHAEAVLCDLDGCDLAAAFHLMGRVAAAHIPVLALSAGAARGLRLRLRVLAYVICRIHNHIRHLLRVDDNEAAGAAIGEASEIAQWLRCQPLLDRAQTIQAAKPRTAASRTGNCESAHLPAAVLHRRKHASRRSSGSAR